MLIFGHRGAIIPNATFYQNSLVAFEEALTVADGFETDAVLDGEGEVFLIHEAKYASAESGVQYHVHEHLNDISAKLLASRRLDQMKTDEVKRLRLKDGSPIPTLRESLTLLSRYPGKWIDIELKGYGVCENVLRIAKEFVQKKEITADQIMISSSSIPYLKIVKRQASEFRLGVVLESPDMPIIPMFPWQEEKESYYTTLTAEALKDTLLQKIQPDYFVIPEEILTRETIDLVTTYYPSAQLMAWVFTEKAFKLEKLIERLKACQKTGKVAAIMVDDLRQFRAAWQA